MDILRKEVQKTVSRGELIPNTDREINRAAPEQNWDKKNQLKNNSQRWLMKANRLFFLIFMVICLAALGAAGYFYRANLVLKKQLPDINSNQDRQISEIIDRVGRLIVLPQGEEPTVATVSDPEKLKDQAFFANAKAGDKVLIYSKAQKAILYDPAADKIIEVAPLNLNSAAVQSVVPTSTPAPPASRGQF